MVKGCAGDQPAEGAGVAPKKIDGLITFLENNAAGSNAGGLKFKDPPKTK